MKRAHLPIILLILVCQSNFHCANRQNKSSGRIVIEADFSKYFYKELRSIFEMKSSVTLQYSPFNYLESAPPITVVEENVENEKAKWVLNSDQPLFLNPPFGNAVIIYPGDSLHIAYLHHEPIYSGNNTEVCALLTELMKADKKIPEPNKKYSTNASTLEDYLQWNAYLDIKANSLLPIIESFKEKIPAIQYEYYRTSTVSQIENDRVRAFGAFSDSVLNGYPGLTAENLNIIWDTTQYKPLAIWLRSVTDYTAAIQNIYSFTRMEIRRRFNFNYGADSLNNKPLRTYLYYTEVKNNYQGLMRERLMAYVLDEPTITELGAKDPMTQMLLKDYYNQPGFPEYKNWVKNLEKNSKY